MNPAEGNDSAALPSVGSCICISGLFLYFWFVEESQGAPGRFWWESLLCYRVLPVEGTPSMLSVLRKRPLGSKLTEVSSVLGASLKKDMALPGVVQGLLGSFLCSGFDLI